MTKYTRSSDPGVSSRSGAKRAVRAVLLGAVVASGAACTPTINVMGTYFPGSLAAATIGVVSSYLVVAGLARRPGLRPLAQSGLLFVALAVLLGCTAWWSLFRVF